MSEEHAESRLPQGGAALFLCDFSSLNHPLFRRKSVKRGLSLCFFEKDLKRQVDFLFFTVAHRRILSNRNLSFSLQFHDFRTLPEGIRVSRFSFAKG